MAPSANRYSKSAGPNAGSEFNTTASDIARFGSKRKQLEGAKTSRLLPISESDALLKVDRDARKKKIILSIVILAVLSYLSFGISGNNGDYNVYGPIQVASVIYNALAGVFHNVTGFGPVIKIDLDHVDYFYYLMYYHVLYKIQVVGITLLCAILLSISGMLYQNVFKNPLAGPGMLGVSSGVTLGIMVLMFAYGTTAYSLITQRYLLCYGFGALILVIVLIGGKWVSGKGRPLDIMSMLLFGMILSQLISALSSYYILWVADMDVYQTFTELSQMLEVDTSLYSWIVLFIVCAVTLIPVYLLRFRFNALSFTDDETRLMGVNLPALRFVALILGAIMILAAQIHIGAVAMVSLIVPFLSRAWFGCEFRNQLVGNVCISTILLLICRDIADLIPFAYLGIGVGTVVSVAALPIFIFIMARHMRGWE